VTSAMDASVYLMEEFIVPERSSDTDWTQLLLRLMVVARYVMA